MNDIRCLCFFSLPFIDEAPLSVDIRRNGAIESSHSVDIAVVDGDGRIVLGYGETERAVFPRSAMKPLQAITLIEQLQNKNLMKGLSDELVCMTCASHNGQPAHLQAVRELLAVFDITPILACGSHWSLEQDSLIEQVRSTLTSRSSCIIIAAANMPDAGSSASDGCTFVRLSTP